VTRVEQDSEHGALITRSDYLSGLRVKTTNPREFATTTHYLAWDAPGYALPIRSEQPEGKVVEIARHPQFGWPLSLTQRSADGSQSHTRRYVYDGYAQLCKTIEPETGATVTGYDGAGNPAWQASGLTGSGYGGLFSCDYTEAIASGRVALRGYDPRNRLTTLSFADGRGDQVWTYTKDGLPATITTYNGANRTEPVTNAYAYNKRRMLDGQADVVTQGWYTWGIGYGYNDHGDLKVQTYPTGLSVDYAPNALGQATQAGNYAANARYFPNGALKQFSYGNGLVHTMQQNARQLPQRVTSSGNVLDYDYRYDANANPVEILDHVTGTPSPRHRWMQYDGLDRLTQAASAAFGGTDHTHRFRYDALDNLTAWKHAGIKDYAEYIYDPHHRLTAIRNTQGQQVVGLSYDDQGNLSEKDGQAYDFDTGNRLRSVPGKERYRYDGLGRRAQTLKPSGETTLWQYSHGGQMLFSSTWQGDFQHQTTHEHIYLAGSIVAIVDHRWPSNETIATKYQHTDALGSPVAVTNEQGQVVERNDYEPYGAIIGKPNRSGIGYTGHVMDGATGLTYMQQRYYDQSIGRFLSTDPVQANPNDGTSFNRYRYAANNPYRFIDPDGRQESISDYMKYSDPVQRKAQEEANQKTLEFLQDFIPVWGDAKGIKEAYDEPTTVNIVAAGVGLLGPIGDGLSKALKQSDNLLEAFDSVEVLSRAAAQADRNGFTAAGRSLQKHGSRTSSKWVQGDVNVNKPLEANLRAQELVDDVLTTPGTVITKNPRGGIDVTAPDGRVIRYNRDGSFQGLRE
jgi:RHS repeat-associated protein